MAVDRVRSDLPTDLQQPTVSAVNTTGEAVQVYAVANTALMKRRLLWYVDERWPRRAGRGTGVGRFDRVGAPLHSVRYWRRHRPAPPRPWCSRR